MTGGRRTPASQQRSPRERVVYAAAQQLRSAGPTAASLRAIVRDARAPWGSLRHYFPGGKEQILSEALAWSGGYAAADVAEYLQSADPTPGGLFVHLLDGWARELRRYDFGRGCPVAAATLDPGEGTPGLIDATRNALDRWLTAIEDALSAMGVKGARSQARSMLSMLEGGIIISRVQRSTTALSELRQFAPHFDAAAQPDLPRATGPTCGRHLIHAAASFGHLGRSALRYSWAAGDATRGDTGSPAHAGPSRLSRAHCRCQRRLVAAPCLVGVRGLRKDDFDREPAAEFGFRSDGGAVCSRDGADDGESQAVPVLVVGPAPLEPLERLEQAADFVRRYECSCVDHRQHRSVILDPGHDPDAAAGDVVADGVGQQIGD